MNSHPEDHTDAPGVAEKEDFYFRGFQGPRYTQTPDELFDELLAPGVLTEAELRVLLYIVRRTFGFKKDADAISLSQLTDGIVTREGRRLDWGAGVKRAAASRAVQGLERKGIIHAERTQSVAHGHETTVYRLRLMDTPPQYPKDTRVVSQRDQPRISKEPALVSSTNPQETVQHTVRQEDGSASLSEAESTPLAAPYSPYLAAVVLDHARDLGCPERGVADLNLILRAWQTGGLTEADFVERLHAAKKVALKRERVARWNAYLAACNPPSAADGAGSDSRRAPAGGNG